MPLLFTVYFDELITRLKSSGLGCNIGDNYFGAQGYAGDLTLLSTSVNALTQMITICDSFANEYSVMFNAKKTAGIQFGQQKELCEIKLNGQVINWRTSVKHLGNIVDNDCRSKRDAFIGSANRCIGDYNHHKDCTKRKLWQAYCSSIYGSPLWLCKSNSFNECCTAWRKATRRFFNLPYRTHNCLVGPLSGQCSIHETLYIRTLEFMRPMLASAYPLIAYIGYMAKSSAASPMGQNIAF